LSKNYTAGGERICAVDDTLLIYLFPWQYRSTDNGKTWTEVSVDDYTSFKDFVVTKKNKLFCSVMWDQCCPTHHRPQIRFSETVGSSWSDIATTGLSTIEYWTNYNAICSVDTALLLGVSEKDNKFTIYKSVNDGITWSKSDLGIVKELKVTGFAVTENNVVYAIDTRDSIAAIYKSADTGNTWEKVDVTGLADYNLTFKGIGAVGNTVLLSAENKKGDYAVFRFQDKTVVNHLKSAADFKAYPNPSDDFITIESNSKNSQKIREIEIVSVNGAILKSFNSNFERLNIADLTPGIYFLKIMTEERFYLNQLVKVNR